MEIPHMFLLGKIALPKEISGSLKRVECMHYDPLLRPNISALKHGVAERARPRHSTGSQEHSQSVVYFLLRSV